MNKVFMCDHVIFETIKTFEFKDIWIIIEKHYKRCDCSYCQKLKFPIELWFPKSKSKHAWHTLAIKLFNIKLYFRLSGIGK